MTKDIRDITSVDWSCAWLGVFGVWTATDIRKGTYLPFLETFNCNVLFPRNFYTCTNYAHLTAEYKNGLLAETINIRGNSGMGKYCYLSKKLSVILILYTAKRMCTSRRLLTFWRLWMTQQYSLSTTIRPSLSEVHGGNVFEPCNSGATGL